MKKTILVIVVAMILLMSFVIPVSASGEATVDITYSSGETLTRGDTVTITVGVANFSEAIKAGVLQVDYNEEILSFIYDDSYFELTNTSMADFYDGTPNGGFVLKKARALDGGIVTMYFTVSDDATFGSSEISLQLQLKDESEENIIFDETVTKTITIVCPHTNTTEKDAVAPTCQVPGVKAGTYCNDCKTYIDGGEIWEDSTAHSWPETWTKGDETSHTRNCTNNGCTVVDAQPHVWKKGETEAPSCDEPGTQHYACDCSATKSETLEATGEHKYGDWFDNENGGHTRKCTTCTGDNPVTQTEEHTWNAGKVTTEPTCHTKGEKTYTCEVETCGATKTEPVNADETLHKWVFKMDSDGKDGKHIEYCQVEGCTVSKEATAHTWDAGEVTTDPGCNTEGVKTYTCKATGCGATYTEEVAATGNHTYGPWVNDGVNADGTGTHTRTCTTCDTTGAVAKETVNHTWNAGEVTTNPGCNTTGVRTYTCTAADCGATYTESIKATGNHTYGDWKNDGVNEDGSGTHTRICTTCDEEGDIAKETEDHCWDKENGVIKEEPTCHTMGKTEYACKDCDATYIVTDIPATGEHDWKYTNVDKDGHTAVCENDGCTATLDKTAHTWNNGEITTPPSCVDGVKTFICTADGCGATYTEAVPATGEHVWGVGEYLDETNHVLTCIGCKTTTKNETHYYVEKWEPLDSDSTKHVRYCASCGDERTVEIKDHAFSGEWTYGEDGIATRICICGAIEICDHEGKWNDGVITTPAKCDESGVKTYTCSYCACTKTESIPELGHNFEKSEWKQVDNQYHQRSCANEDCEEVERAEHGWTEGEKEQQYVCHDGIQHYSCPDCNGTKTEKIPAIDHDYKVCEKVDEKTHKHICDVCKDEKVENHDWDEGEIKRPAGTNGKDDPGEALYTCEDCGATELRELHTHEFTWKSDAEKHWKECECGDVEEGTTERHDLDDGVIIHNATHTKTGLSSHKCEVCNATIEQTIAKTSDHSYGSWRPYGPNEHISSCACGAIKTAAHSFGAWTVTKAATSEAEGVESRSCSGCGYTETRTIAKLPAEETTTETTTEETTTAETTTETTTVETTTSETTTETTTKETTTAETTTVETTIAETTTETTTAETTMISEETHEIEVEKTVWKPGKKNSGEGMSFRSYADFADFVGVRVDGVEISRDLYDVREGSTIVVLKAEYLEELSTGMHTIEIVSVTGVASASFEVAESGNNGWIALVCIAIVAVGVIAGAVFFMRKKKNA